MTNSMGGFLLPAKTDNSGFCPYGVQKCWGNWLDPPCILNPQLLLLVFMEVRLGDDLLGQSAAAGWQCTLYQGGCRSLLNSHGVIGSWNDQLWVVAVVAWDPHAWLTCSSCLCPSTVHYAFLPWTPSLTFGVSRLPFGRARPSWCYSGGLYQGIQFYNLQSDLISSVCFLWTTLRRIIVIVFLSK